MKDSYLNRNCEVNPHDLRKSKENISSTNGDYHH